MKRLMIGIAAASLLSTASFATQAEERGGRSGYSRGPTHAPAYSHAQRAAPRHYQSPRSHYAPPRHHYGAPRSYGPRAHSGWRGHYRAPRHWGHNRWSYSHRAYRHWR